MKKFLVFSLFILIGTTLISQELNCRISVSSSKIQGTNKQVFQTLQSELYDFINNTKWTNHIYNNDERIECNILINIEEQISTDEFKGSIQVQSRRPVYNTTYNSVMMNLVDKNFQFRYVEFQSLEFSETSHMSNLTSVLAFYIYTIIGFDYDSFSLEGGTPYFQKAKTIVNNAQNAKEKGWKAYEDQKNRYWLIENILNNKYSQAREFTYRYHRIGLDRMSDKPTESRAEIADNLKLLQKVYRNKPNPFMPFIKVILEAKSDEFVNIFSEGFADEKNRVFVILKEIDATNTTKYEKIRKPAN